VRLLGFRTVDTDEGVWTEWSEAEGGYVWREEPMAELLTDQEGPSLYVSGTVSNQGRFYDGFDAVVLLSAPADVLLCRIETRTTNPFGKTPAQREAVLRDLAEIEPRLRGTCTHRSTLLSRSKTSSPCLRNSAATLPVRSSPDSAFARGRRVLAAAPRQWGCYWPVAGATSRRSLSARPSSPGGSVASPTSRQPCVFQKQMAGRL
jgi:hypothetical protein